MSRILEYDGNNVRYYSFECPCGQMLLFSSAQSIGAPAFQIIKVRHGEDQIAAYNVARNQALDNVTAASSAKEIMTDMADNLFYKGEGSQKCSAAFQWGQAMAVMIKLEEGES